MSYVVDWELVRENMKVLVGRHDFSSFCSSGSGAEHAVCAVDMVDVERDGIQWVFRIQANRFVYKMVRSVVGTLVDIGRGKIQDSMSEILASRRRDRAGTTAPACGLILERVTYPEEGM
jgi:tRNA pseudouridine38-40 synthase